MKNNDLHEAYFKISKISIELRQVHHEIFNIIPHSTSQVMHATTVLLDAIEEGLAVLYNLEDE